MLVQGDNTEAFGGNFMQIYLTAEDATGAAIPLPPMDKIEIRVGSIKKYYDPQPIINVNFSEEETATFGAFNTMYVAAYDETTKKSRAIGSYVFSTCPRRV
jgi:hypothetical protein